MLKKMLFAVLASAALFISAADNDGNAYKYFDIRGKLERDNPVYKPGEEMVFTFKAKNGGRPFEAYLKWTRSGDDGKTESGIAKVTKNEPLVVKTSTDKPGFVKVVATLCDKDGNVILKPGKNSSGVEVYRIMGAGVDIDKLGVSVPEPAGFDAFWDAQKKRLAAVPMKDVVREEIPSKNPDFKVYRVAIPCAGATRATGHLIIPANAKGKSLPVTMQFHGYGMTGRNPPENYAVDTIVFNVNAHGMELGKDNDYYEKFNNDRKWYALGKVDKPEDSYFTDMILRDLRAAEYARTLPEWNGKDFTVSGGSQGGFQSILVAALDPNVTFCKVAAPWCCDMAGSKAQKRMPSNFRPEYSSAMEYFEPVHHAKRIKCPVSITRAGLADYCCPPSGLATFYNALSVKKKADWVQCSEHQHWITPTDFQRFTIED